MLFDFDAMPHGNRYKLLVSCVVPRPIAWVVSRDAAGVLNAAPYSFFNVFGEDPAVVAISCGPRPEGSAKDTLANIQATGEFTVCLVPHALAEQMVVTAADFPPGVDELAEAGLATIPSTKIATPRIADSPVAMECTLWKIIPVGVHSMVMGEVKAMHVADEAVMNPERAYIDTPVLDLVGRMHGRGWYSTTRDRVEFPRITPAEWAARKKATE
ncbi:flavin reductase family protein [Roseomonas stagni]|uniref:Flavin reductase family protein n=1 Tax=Falsiroseomonas algicola TaxID=2716930 RepID=A0A6M1LFU1_9PROT|nr:flavin reductase family protein [Falsiroseomonas algicola]NGM19238.1 flavin reductase family protein [Falsiroseomonas algicola]